MQLSGKCTQNARKCPQRRREQSAFYRTLPKRYRFHINFSVWLASSSLYAETARRGDRDFGCFISPFWSGRERLIFPHTWLYIVYLPQNGGSVSGLKTHWFPQNGGSGFFTLVSLSPHWGMFRLFHPPKWGSQNA